MNMYMQLLQNKIIDISNMILAVDEMVPTNERQGDDKKYILNHLMDVRRCLREAVDFMNIYDHHQ